MKRTSFCASRLFAPFASPQRRGEVTANTIVARIFNNRKNAAKPRTAAGTTPPVDARCVTDFVGRSRLSP